jgi:hypothetical protein
VTGVVAAGCLLWGACDRVGVPFISEVTEVAEDAEGLVGARYTMRHCGHPRLAANEEDVDGRDEPGQNGKCVTRAPLMAGTGLVMNLLRAHLNLRVLGVLADGAAMNTFVGCAPPELQGLVAPI